jgi:hypothetical protein
VIDPISDTGPDARLDEADAGGFTLIELIVYIGLATVVLVIVGAFLINGLTGEKLVRSVTDATNVGQAVTSGLQNDVRNSTFVTVKAGTGTGDLMVVAKTAGSASVLTYECVAWYFSKANKEIRVATSASAISTPTAATLATWTLVAKGIVPSTGGAAVFAGGPDYLNIAFTVTAGDNKAVPFATSVTSRAATEGTATC